MNDVHEELTFLHSVAGQPNDDHPPRPPDSDDERPPLAKIDSRPPCMPFYYQAVTEQIASLDDLSQHLRDARGFSCVALTRCGLAKHVDPETPFRKFGVDQADGTLATLIDVPRRWLYLDVEPSEDVQHQIWDREITAADFATDPGKYAKDIRERLPERMRGAGCYWAVSGSGGVKDGVRLHMVFWLDKPVTNACLKRMLKPYARSVGIDLSLYDRGRLIFTARPISPDRPESMPEDGFLDGHESVRVWEPEPERDEREYASVDQTRDVTRADLEGAVFESHDRQERNFVSHVLEGAGPAGGSGEAHDYGCRVLGRLRDLFPDATADSLRELLRPWGERGGFDPQTASFADIADRPGRIPVDSPPAPRTVKKALERAHGEATRRRRSNEKDTLVIALGDPSELVHKERGFAAQSAIREGASPKDVGAYFGLAESETRDLTRRADAAGRKIDLDGWGSVTFVEKDDRIQPVFDVSPTKLAQRWVERHRGEYTYQEGVWWEYTGTHWEQLEARKSPLASITEYVERAVGDAIDHVALQVDRDKALRAGLERAKVSKVAGEAQSFCASVEWDTHHTWINTPGGTYNLETGECRPHSPADHITQCTSAKPDFSDEMREDLLSALRQWAPEGDRDDWVSCLQRAVGYSIIGPGSVKSGGGHVLLCLGDTKRERNGANGKSTFFGLARNAFGSYVKPIPQSAIAGDHRTHTGSLGNMTGSRCGYVDETNEIVLNTDALKAITSTEPINVQLNIGLSYGDRVLGLGVWIATNKDLHIRDQTHGAKRRIHVVPWLRSLKEDPRIGLEITQRLPGALLAWAMEGARKYMEDPRLPHCGSVEEATNAKFTEGDHIADFVDECCVRDPNGRVTRSEIWAKYAGRQVSSGWCGRNGYRQRSAQGFYSGIRSLGFEECKTKGERGFLGLRLRTTQQGWCGSA